MMNLLYYYQCFIIGLFKQSQAHLRYWCLHSEFVNLNKLQLNEYMLKRYEILNPSSFLEFRKYVNPLWNKSCILEHTHKKIKMIWLSYRTELNIVLISLIEWNLSKERKDRDFAYLKCLFTVWVISHKKNTIISNHESSQHIKNS